MKLKLCLESEFMVTVKKISDFIDSIAPYNAKCEWDNCGILVGDKDKEIKKIGFTLDLTSEVLSDAINNNVDLIITHHPIIFRPVKNFLKGNLAYELAVSGISAISANTSPMAALAMEQLPKLRGCQAHVSVIVSGVDKNVYRKLGLNLTCEPAYATKKLYHK